jgi:hypothetical protein
MSTRYKIAAESFNYQIIGKVTREFYVYTYMVHDTPFYVGVGKRGTLRCLHHFSLLDHGNKYFIRKLKKLRCAGTLITIKIIRCSDNRNTILDLERRLIYEYGQVNQGGILCNITDGGDGGDTYKGRKKFHNPETGETKAFYPGKQPKNWIRGGNPEKVQPTIVCYDPNNNHVMKVFAHSKIPKGYCLGRPKGVKTGPTGKVIISNPKTQEYLWVLPNTSLPKGWIRGRSHKSSTQGRTAYYDPITKQKKYFINIVDVPNGWVKGIPPTTGKTVIVGTQKFSSVVDAARHFGLTRYKFCNRYL